MLLERNHIFNVTPMRGVHANHVKFMLLRRSLSRRTAERPSLSHWVAVGRILDLWIGLMSSVGQGESIVPPDSALLHIHTTRAESNKRRLRGINCLTWEKRLIVGRHRQTMLQLWELGCKLLLLSCMRMLTLRMSTGWKYPCELVCRLVQPSGGYISTSSTITLPTGSDALTGWENWTHSIYKKYKFPGVMFYLCRCFKCRSSHSGEPFSPCYAQLQSVNRCSYLEGCPNSIAGLMSLVDMQTYNLLISKTLICRTWDYCSILIPLKQGRCI